MKKNCKFCRSEIDSECSVCPVCRHVISPLKFSLKNPYLIPMLMIIVGMFFVFGFSAYMKQKVQKDFEIKTFSDAQTHKLKIIGSKEMGPRDNRYIVGEVKNEGNDTFTSLTVESEFFDKEKNLIRIGQAYISGTIGPNEKRGFQISNDCQAKSDGVYDKYKLRIVDGILKHRKE